MPEIDSSVALVRELDKLMESRGQKQLLTAQASGIGQTTISRWIRALRANEPIDVDPVNEARLRNYLIATGWFEGDQAGQLGKQIAAHVIETEIIGMVAQVAQRLRNEANRAAEGGGQPGRWSESLREAGENDG